MEFNAEYISKEKTLNLLGDAHVNGINSLIDVELKADGGTSDGHHTFDELYYHRMILFSIICSDYSHLAWKSKLHADGTMYDDYFIVGITTPQGDYTYHYHIDYWNNFNVIELERAPEYDGHKPEDITRLLSLLD